MTNIAFITLVILVMAFPGYVLRASYYAGTFTRTVLPKSWTDDIARAVLYSLPLHVVAMAVFEILEHWRIIHTTLNFEIAYRVLVGQYDQDLPMITRDLYANKLYLGMYYVSVLAGAFALGHLFRLIVWGGKWDVKLPWLLRYRNEWLYTLLGRDVPIPPKYKGGKVYVRIEALTKIPMEEKGKGRLYRGFVEAFTTEDSGALRDILITGAERGKFRNVLGTLNEQTFYWKPVSPGDLMILKYSEMLNLNITYLIDVPASRAEAPAASPPRTNDRGQSKSFPSS
jgi:hypothetical protein